MQITPLVSVVLGCALSATAMGETASRVRERPPVATPARALLAPADSAPRAASTTPAAPVPAAATPVSSGMRVWIDPKTGELTSTPTDAQRREAAAQDDANRLYDASRFTIERLPSGAEVLHTNGGNQSVLMVRPGADGTLQMICTDALHRHVDPTRHDADPAHAATRDER